MLLLFSNAPVLFAVVVSAVAPATATEKAVGLNGSSNTVHRREQAETPKWREDLPWTDLASKISASASLVDTSPELFLAECTPEFDVPILDPLQFNWTNLRSNHGLIDQPSGVCMDHLFCAFEQCYPKPTNSSNTTLSERLNDTGPPFSGPPFSGTLYSTLDPKLKEWVDDTSNPSYNLPSKVLFPVVASDIVAAVKFAKEHGLEISVKNSGHSYAGASTKKNTLHLNMNRYTQYAINNGVTDCDASSDSQEEIISACRLSLAKGKSAVIRVGGGENWDKTYRAVKKANEEQEGGYKYHVVGGSAGTISPMGWTFQGGLGASTGGRTFGFGADQVTQLEMVLPNGHHVKFGPSEWEDEEGYDVPRTTTVSGMCRSNDEETDEDKWAWEACPDDLNVNFDDLWFAVRGGGGGTWGVIASIHLQLHEYLPLETIQMTFDVSNFSMDQREAFNIAYQNYEIKFLLDPTSINVTEAESNACGCPSGDVKFYCYGKDSAQAFDAAWKRYLYSIRQRLEEDAGIPISAIDAAVNSTDFSIIRYFNDFVETITIPAGPYAGKALDFPQPDFAPAIEAYLNVIVPKKWILQNIDSAVELVPPSPWSFRAFGGRASGPSSDQSNALSDAHREGGYMIFGAHSLFDDLFYTHLFPGIYDTSDKTNFPGFIGSNHAGPNTRGPLKSDWTKACPLNWTQEERDEKCISLQEAIYGTKMLKRLEGIKETIDPNYMFDCYSCIGNNRVKSVHGPASSTPTSIDEAPPTQSPTEGTSSAIASPDGAPPTRSPTEGTSSPIASIDGAPPTQSPTEGTSSAIAIVTSVQTFFQIILVGAFVSL